MIILNKTTSVIRITGDTSHVVTAYLRIFLANKRLTDKQLEVTSALVSRYAEYITNGVSEPYASQLLFSTETRKGIYNELGMGSPHLNNTFNALCNKGILAKDDGRYIINPSIVPTAELTFKFSIDDKPRPNRVSNSKKVRVIPEGSGADSEEPVHDVQEVNDNQEYEGYSDLE